MHVLLHTSGSTGDILPFVRVGAALIERGHRATLVTHAGFADLSSKVGLDYVATDTAQQYQEYLANASDLNTPKGIGRFLKHHCLPFVEDTVAAIEQRLEPASLIVSCPTFDIAPRLVAERTGQPLMWLFTAPVQVTSWTLRKMMRDAMYRGLLGEGISAIRDQLQMAPITNWDQWLDYSQPSIGQWAGWFAEPEESWLPGVNPVGFLRDHQAESPSLSREIQDFLEVNPRPVLITGGTGDYLDQNFFAAALTAAQQHGLPAIVVTRYPDRLPAERPLAYMVIEGAPFGLLIPHCGAVVHHGGLGTMAAAISAACPQLILAFGADRPDNGRRVSGLGIGQSIDVAGWQTEAVGESLAQVYFSEQMAASCKAFSVRVAEGNAAHRACELIEGVSPTFESTAQ